MWRLWLVCAACSSHAPQPIATSAPSIPVAKPIAAPTTQMLARVGYRNATGWTDIAIDGIGEAARAWCSKLVERHLRRKVGPLTPEIVRGCEPVELPPVRATGFITVARNELDVLAIAAIGVPDPDKAPTGSTAQIAWFADTDACERWRERLVLDARRGREALVAETSAFALRQLEDAIAREKTACNQPVKLCAPTDVPCNTEQEERALQCRIVRERIDHLRPLTTRVEPPAYEPPPCTRLGVETSTSSSPGRS